MTIHKIALFSASWLIIGVAALSGTSFAAESTAKKPAASQPITKPDAHDMAAHDMTAQSEAQKDGMACCGQMSGMKCGQMGSMMGDHKDGMKCGQMGDQMGGMKCDHKDSMMGGQGSGMMMESPRMNMLMSLDLNDEQRSKINKLSDELKHNNWATKGLIMDESAKLRDLYAADKRDPSAIGKEYQKIFDLQRKMIEATITTQNRIEELLTPEQRAQLKNMRHGGEPVHDHTMH